MVGNGVEEELAHDWLLVRKEKKCPSTRTEFLAVKREAEKVGMTMNDAVRICCERSWAGFNPIWLERDKTIPKTTDLSVYKD